MNMVKKNTFAVAAFASLTALAAGCSQEADGSTEGDVAEAGDTELHATADMHMVAVEALREATKDTFDQGQVDMLANVAHQQVVAGHCEGFEIDPARMAEEMNRLHYNDKGEQLDISEDELHTLEKKALLGLGMAVGSQLMIAEMDMDGFCAAASEDREAAADGSHVIYADPAPSET